jgi:putative membrane protein
MGENVKMIKSKTIPFKNIDPRVSWAKERTFLAWIRTGLALMGLGFVVARFNLFLRMMQIRPDAPVPAHTGESMWFGTCLVLLGVLVLAESAINYTRFVAVLKRGRMPELKPAYLGVVIALGLGFIGVMMAVYLILNN